MNLNMNEFGFEGVIATKGRESGRNDLLPYRMWGKASSSVLSVGNRQKKCAYLKNETF